jgi:hypothetical protein
MGKEKIEHNDLYHLTAFLADALKDYGAIRYLDEEGVAHVLMTVDELEFDSGADITDRLVQITPKFVKIQELDVKLE